MPQLSQLCCYVSGQPPAASIDGGYVVGLVGGGVELTYNQHEQPNTDTGELVRVSCHPLVYGMLRIQSKLVC